MSHQVQDTSINAYYGEVVDTLGNRQMEVLRKFAENYTRDFTNAELAEELHWPINTITPRVYELRGMDKNIPIDPGNPILIEVRRRTCSVTGRTAIAWGMNPDYKRSQFKGFQNLGGPINVNLHR